MKTIESIRDCQNRIEMLEAQFAARMYFNSAEKLYYWFCFVNGLIVVLIFCKDEELKTIITVALTVMQTVIAYRVNSCVSRGAQCRLCFDRTVLGFTSLTNSLDEEMNTRELIKKAIRKYDKKYDYQINNNGLENPGGVKDWYILDESDSAKKSPPLYCLKQNISYTKEHFKIRSAIDIFLQRS